MLHDELMPPEDEPPLQKKQLDTFRRWIEAGTPFKDKTDPATLLAAGEVDQHDIQPRHPMERSPPAGSHLPMTPMTSLIPFFFFVVGSGKSTRKPSSRPLFCPG